MPRKKREHFCSGRSHDDRMGSRDCSRVGKYKEEKKWWCWQHRPSYQKARADARDAQWEAEWNRDQKTYKLELQQDQAEDRLILKCHKLADAGDVDDAVAEIIELSRKLRKVDASLEKHLTSTPQKP